MNYYRNNLIFFGFRLHKVLCPSLNNALPRRLSNTQIVEDVQVVEATTRCIPKTIQDFHKQKTTKPYQPKDPKLLQVAILGEPNAGKSTLINSLMGWRVCPVSKKVHTTRHRAVAVSIYDNTQIVFLDTPGIVTSEHCKKHNLETSFVMDPKNCLKEADMIAVIVDASNKWTRLRINPHLLQWLNKFSEKQCILILNKVDLIKSKVFLLDLTRTLTKGFVGGMPIRLVTKRLQLRDRDLKGVLQKLKRTSRSSSDAAAASNEEELEKDGDAEDASEAGFDRFDRVFMVSALNLDGVRDVKEYLIESARPRPWTYHSSVVTDQNPQHLAVLTVREKLLNYLPEEVPYALTLKIQMWEVAEGDVLKIAVSVMCRKKGHAKMIVGPEGKTITAIAKEARQDLANTFRCDVALKLIVKSSAGEENKK